MSQRGGTDNELKINWMSEIHEFARLKLKIKNFLNLKLIKFKIFTHFFYFKLGLILLQHKLLLKRRSCLHIFIIQIGNLKMIKFLFKAGIYNVQMWAFGAAGLSNILTKTLKIQKPVNNDHVSVSIQEIIVTPPGKKILKIILKIN